MNIVPDFCPTLYTYLTKSAVQRGFEAKYWKRASVDEKTDACSVGSSKVSILSKKS